MWNELAGKSVLITGGTRGIGLATALAFARRGAHVTVTHKWGSVDDARLLRLFEAQGATPPRILCADASSKEDTLEVIKAIAATHSGVDIFVSNVSFAQVTRSIEDYTKRGLRTSLDYSVWPLLEYLRAIKASFDRYPRYVIASSSAGPDHYHLNYDFVASAKAALETLCRYLCVRLRREGVHVNALRARFVRTDSLTATMGEDFTKYLETHAPSFFIEPDEVASAALALCSGAMDAVNGQVLTIDRGTSFSDTLMGAYERRRSRLGSGRPQPTDTENEDHG